jgi:hypothetical protein
VNQRAQVALGDCTGYVENKVSELGRAHAIARQIRAVSNRFYTLCGMQEITCCSQTKFLLVELRSHEEGRHLNRDTYMYIIYYGNQARRCPANPLLWTHCSGLL